MKARSFRDLGIAAAALTLAAIGFAATAGAQQGLPPPPRGVGAPPPGMAPGAPGASSNPVCVRLEGQLAALDRGGQDAGRVDQIRRYEDSAAKQQAELDRLVAQSRRNGCESTGFFSLFSGQSPQCGPMNNQIQQMRANLDKMLSDLQRLKGGSAEAEGPRRALLVALAQNNCGPQYRTAVQDNQPRNMLDALFGPNNVIAPAPGLEGQTSGLYRTLCVRTCDGFYFPVSYSTVPSKFPDDERVCKNMCPAAEAVLYAHRNPGEDVAQSVSISGQPYSSLPNAFKYRKEFSAACACKPQGQTWSEALKQIDDQTVERGDIVVTQERAKQLSLPPPTRTSTSGRQPANAAQQAKPAAAAPADAPAAAAQETDPSKKTIRSVGPTFVPVR